jgi:hypothetical protein
MAIVSIIALLFLYTSGIFLWDKLVAWRLSRKVSKTIKYVHYLTLFVALSIVFTYSQFGVGLRGLWTTRTFVIIALLTGVFFNFVTDKTIMNKMEKVYFKLFSLLPTLTGVILFIPILGVVTVISLLGNLIDPVNKIYFEDEHLRIQSSFTGVLVPPCLEIFAKNSIFEKHIYSPDFRGKDLDSITVSYDNDSTRIYVYSTTKEDFFPKVICTDKQK